MATTTIGTIQLIASIDTSKYKQGAKEIEKANSNIESSTDSTERKSNKSFSRIAKIGLAAVATAAVAAGAAIVSNLGNAVRRVDTLNNFPKVMANLGYGADEANKSIDALDKGVRGLPTSLNEIASALQNIAPGADSLDEATKLTLALNNALVAGGKDAGLQASAMEQFSQAVAKGRPDMMEWRSIAAAMPGQLKQISNSLGFDNWQEMAQAVTDGKLAFKDVQKAIINLNEKGLGKLPSFANQARNATDGLATGWKNMQTAITRGLGNIIQAVGSKNISTSIANIGKVFENATKYAIKFGEGAVTISRQIGDYLSPKFTALWRNISEELMPVLKDLWKNVIEPLIPVIGVTLVAAIGFAVDALNVIVEAFGWVIQAIQDGNPIILGLIGAFGALALAMALNSAFRALTIGFNLLTTTTIPKAIAKIAVFRGLVASPMVMGAIGIGAAIAAIALVKAKLDEYTAAMEKTFDETKRAAESQSAAVVQLRNLARSGDSATRQRALDALGRLGYADGGFTGIGATNEIAGVVHRGEYVIPKSQVDQSTGTPKAMGDTFSITVNASANMIRSEADKRQFATMIVDAFNQTRTAKGLPALG